MNTPPTAPPATIATIVGTKPRPSSIPIAPRTIVNAEELAVNQNGNRPRAVPKRAEPGIGLIVYCSTTSLIGYPCRNDAKNGLISPDHSVPPKYTLDRGTPARYALTLNQNGSRSRALPQRAEPGIGLIVCCST